MGGTMGRGRSSALVALTLLMLLAINVSSTAWGSVPGANTAIPVVEPDDATAELAEMETEDQIDAQEAQLVFVKASLPPTSGTMTTT